MVAKATRLLGLLRQTPTALDTPTLCQLCTVLDTPSLRLAVWGIGVGMRAYVIQMSQKKNFGEDYEDR